MNGPNPRFRIYKPDRFYRSILRDVLRGRWRRGNDVERLERRIREVTGAPEALATAQARVAIYLAVRAIVERTGKREVVMSPYTIFDVVNMVVAGGGRPAFVDLEDGTCNISAARVEEAVTGNTAAVLATHLQGLACEVERIAAFCRERGVALVEDCAQAFGTCVGDRHVGTFGDIGIFSFGLAKNVNGIYGGMAIGRASGLLERMREIEAEFPAPSLGWILSKAAYAFVTDLTLTPFLFGPFFFRLFRFGYLHDVDFLNRRVTVEDNPVLRREFPLRYRRRMTPLQARLVLRQLDGVARDREIRRRYARLYWSELGDLPGLVLPPWRPDLSHTYLAFSVQVEDRREFVAYLMRNDRDCAPQHLKNCAGLPCFAPFAADCPVAERTAARNVLLPTYPGYGEDQVRATIGSVRGYFGARRSVGSFTTPPLRRRASHSP